MVRTITSTSIAFIEESKHTSSQKGFVVNVNGNTPSYVQTQMIQRLGVFARSKVNISSVISGSFVFFGPNISHLLFITQK